MYKQFFALLFLLSNICQPCLAQQIITLRSLLKDMTNFDNVARFPSPAYTLKQASSYDRKSVSPDKPGWFANGDFNQFIRDETKNGHVAHVMMDADGPGAIVRFWLTTVVKPGMMRFYIDGEENASIEVPAFDLMKAGFNLGPGLLNPHSSYEPQGKGGNTLYLPILYQKHCKVTWEYTDTAASKTAHYYQINYRTYPPGTRVEPFKMSQLVTEKAAIDSAETALWNPVAAQGAETALSQTISGGGEAQMQLPQGANAVRMFTAQLATANKDDYEKMWRLVILKIGFDGEQTVWCPLGDFIGSGYGGRKIKGWYRELSDDGKLISRWVMPYQKTAKITIINKCNFDISINAAATVSPFTWDANTMYFHTTYKYQENVKDVKWDYDLTKVAKNDSAGPIDWNFATLQGRGVYLGNTLAVNNQMTAWYGEGDAKAYVDNEAFPSEFGTGLEDYYNTSWAPVVLYQTPFANAPRADNRSSAGQNTFTRVLDLDGIPFTKAFAFDLEMLSWTGGTIDAAATTYWYGGGGKRRVRSKEVNSEK